MKASVNSKNLLITSLKKQNFLLKIGLIGCLAVIALLVVNGQQNLSLGQQRGLSGQNTPAITETNQETSRPSIKPSVTTEPNLVPINQTINKQIFADLNEGYAMFWIKKIDGDYASGTGGMEGSGFAWVARKQSNKWVMLWRTQEYPKCSDIEKYAVPASLYEVCYDQNGKIRNQNP